MGKRNIILFSFLLSCLIHGVVFSFIAVRIEKKQSPLIYCWQDILNKKDLTLDKKGALPLGVDFSFHGLRKDYFSQAVFKPQFYKLFDVKLIHPSLSTDNHRKDKTLYFYLWERPTVISSVRQEQVQYTVFVSGQGKVVFSFPHKLPSNSKENILMQEYVREAVNFPRGKFFWTKLEGVLK